MTESEEKNDKAVSKDEAAGDSKSEVEPMETNSHEEKDEAANNNAAETSKVSMISLKYRFVLRSQFSIIRNTIIFMMMLC